ncbi:MAG: hypothetical protein CMF56_06240 [Leifsonia sp.]|nr:hypothetical protein [Leifsonia sp.]|tara:strand:+ start:200942 stop:202003 length:1062 start_codon:yes stop_codon:yes gene_type:complete
MHELKVTGVESGALLLADDDGGRYRVLVDEALRARLRQASNGGASAHKVSPREIQSQIRAGMSAEDVATVTGASLDDIRRFEGPVLAEREYVIQSALAVAVRGPGEADPADSAQFGDIIRGRLLDAGAVDERWASWKEQGGGWIVKLTFSADDVEHDARWGFDPKRGALSPLNREADSLSQHGDMPAPLIPRLRAVAAEDNEPAEPNSRFDSGAFRVEHDDESGPRLEAIPPAPRRPSAERSEPAAAAPPRERASRSNGQTADLLEALRRRRGERDPMDPEPDEQLADRPGTGTVRVIDVPMETMPIDTAVPAKKAAQGPSAAPAPAPKSGRKGRASMPSWDDIVFGARPDDE